MKVLRLLLASTILLFFAGMNTAIAQCTGITAPFTENFDGLALTSPYTALPSCWVPQNSADDWEVTNDVTNNSHTYLPNIGDHTTGSGNYMWIDASSNITANEMITPDIDISTLTTPYVGFWFASNNTNNSVNHSINLDAWDGTAWVNVATESGNFLDWIEVAATLPGSIPSITKFRIYAVAATGTTSSTYYQNDLGVDDFFVIEAPTCLQPTLLSVSNITSTTADFNWTDVNGATSWEIEYGTVGYTLGTGTSSLISTNPLTLSSLTPLTSYDFYIRSVCGPADSSIWEGPISFTTACTNTLNGTYTIGGTNPDYPDIQSAVSFLNTCGITGPVIFNVAAGIYTGAISIGTVTGANATNTVTFNGAGATNTTITHDGSGQRAVILLDGSDYITFQNFTIENTGTSNSYGVHLIGQADFNTIDNCIINMASANTSSVIGVLASGSATSTSGAGNNANYTTISNSTVSNSYYGIRFYGNNSAVPDNTNNTVNNCTINSYYYGIYFYYQAEPSVNGSTVNVTNSSSYGIYSAYSRDAIYSRNTITGARTYGIYLTQNNTAAQNSTKRASITNNMITVQNSGDGIYLAGSDDVDIFYNTVTAENDQALWINSSSNDYDVRNNIFSASGSSYVIDLDANPSANDIIDYNIYYHSGGGVIAFMPLGNFSTLAAWQAAEPTQNINSLEGDPSFLSTTDLHLIGTLANGVATPITRVTTDIDGDIRNTTTPDIGADEYTPPSCSPPSLLSASNLTDISADLSWTIGGSETAWDIEYGATGFTQGTGTMLTAVGTNPYTLLGLTQVTTYDYYLRANCSSSTSPWIGPFTFTTLPTCPAPTALAATNVTTTSADLSWISGSNLSVGEYGPTGFTPGTGTALNTTSPQPISGLTPATAYDFYVVDDCGSVDGLSDTTWFTFATALQPAIGVACTTPGSSSSIIFSENFENNNAGWTGDVGTGNGNWEIPDGATSSNTGASDGYLGGNFMNYEASSTSTNQGSIVSPAIDLTGGINDAELSFWMHAYGASMGTLNIGVGTSATGPFTTVFTWSGPLQTSGTDPWQSVGVNLAAYLGQTIYLEFTQIDDMNNLGSGFDGDMSIDLVEVSTCQLCNIPTALMATNISTTGADFSWTENGTATSWEVEYGTTGFTLGTGMSSVVTMDSISITGLTADTDYDFYVRAICGPGDTSAWSSSSSFFTGYCTPNPSSVDGIGIVNVTMGSINNTTGAETGNYGNYSAMVTPALQGLPLPIDITVSTSIFDYDLWAWVDWNNDLDFDDAGEEFFLGTSLATLNASILIPTTALGNYRIRIGGADSGLGTTSPSDPCYVGSYASFEDYTINVMVIQPDDLGITAISAGNCDSTEVVTIDVSNLGINPQTTVDVSYRVNGGTIVTETWTGSLTTTTTDQHTFATTFNASTPGNYVIEAWTSLPADGNVTNDTFTTTIVTDTIYGVTFSENFEGTTFSGYLSDGTVATDHGSASNVLYKNLWSSAPSFVTISPKIGVISAGDEARLSYRYVEYSGTNVPTTLGAGDTLNILLSIDCGNSYVLLDQIHAGNHTPTSAMTLLQYDLSAYAGEIVNIATVASWGTGDYYLDIDDIYVGPALTSMPNITDVDCNGSMNGSIALNIAGGTAPYTYTWDSGLTTDSISGLGAGVYVYTVTDTMGYMLMDSVTISEPSMLAVSTTGTDLSCNGTNDGTVTAVVTGGTGMYTYTWSNNDTTATLSGLSGGTYDGTITDENGCTITTSTTITEPDAIVLTMSSIADTNGISPVGAASVAVTGGTAPYTFSWSNGGTTADLTSLVTGDYDVTVTDANGCTETGSIFVDMHVSTNNIEYLTELSIAPNPTRGNTVINLELSQNADVAVSIYTVTGVLVKDFGKENTASQTHQIDLSNYANGMYLVRIIVDNQTITRKLMINK